MDTSRISDVDVGYKVFNQVSRSVFIPKGYKLEFSPKKIDVKNEDYRILMEYHLEGDKLLFNKEIIFYNGIIPVDRVKEWNALQLEMSRFYSDFVLLTR
ncbi:MAG: hypothetical protein GC180_02130 [Bacteroidetes bacterium]|nr:hypothetical protein [Bacteroidota bacterium]